jgi:hypothetical protein
MHVIISSCYTYWARCKSWVEGINGLLWGSWIVLAPIHKGGREGGLEEAWLGAFKLHATLTPLAILIGLDANLMTCLDYGEEVHMSRISRNEAIWLVTKWVLHEMGCTLRPRLLQWGTSSMDEKMTWLSTWRHFLLMELPCNRIFLGNLKVSTWNLASGELQLEAFLNCFCFFPSCPSYGPLPQITL